MKSRGPNLAPYKLNFVAHACHLHIWDVAAGRPAVQSHPWRHNKVWRHPEPGILEVLFQNNSLFFFFNVVPYYYKLLSWPGVVVHICNINILKAEAGGSQISGQPWLHCEILSRKSNKEQDICPICWWETTKARYVIVSIESTIITSFVLRQGLVI